MSTHVAGHPVSPHTYANYGCRCDECRQARSAYMKKLRHSDNCAFYEEEKRKNSARRKALTRLGAMYPTEFARLYKEELS
jgi:hypothetical protein